MKRKRISMVDAGCVLLCSAAVLRKAKHAQSGEVGNSEKRRRKLVSMKRTSQQRTLPTLESLKRVVNVVACRRLERWRREELRGPGTRRHADLMRLKHRQRTVYPHSMVIFTLEYVIYTSQNHRSSQNLDLVYVVIFATLPFRSTASELCWANSSTL
jgi:hypothetical protein